MFIHRCYFVKTEKKTCFAIRCSKKDTYLLVQKGKNRMPFSRTEQRSCTFRRPCRLPYDSRVRMEVSGAVRGTAACKGYYRIVIGSRHNVLLLHTDQAYGSVCMGASSVRRWVKHFKDGKTETIQKAVRQCVRMAGTEFYRRGILKLPERWKKCVQRSGGYLEK